MSLVDAATNGMSGQPEAVYCISLTVACSAVLNLNQRNMYVNGAAIQGPFPRTWPAGGGTITNEIRGTIIRGDVNGDGAVNAADVPYLVQVLLQFDANPLHVQAADVNASGTPDGDDIQPFAGLVMGP